MSSDPLSELIGRTHGRPVYLASAFAVAPRFTDDVADLLRQKQPGAVFVNGRGRYRNSSDWRKRWRQERNRYGGAIIMTVPEPLVDDTEPPTGGGIPGAHVVGESVAIEIADFVALGRPVLWLPSFGREYRFISRFTVEVMQTCSTRCYARLFAAADSEPFIPATHLFFSASETLEELLQVLDRSGGQ